MEVSHKQLRSLLIKGFQEKVPLDVKGAPGIGKSELIKDTMIEVAEMEKRKFIFWNELAEEEKEAMLSADLNKVFIFGDLRLSQFDQTDLKGFPNTKKDFAKWVPTLLFKVLSHPSAVGAVFFDEANSASPSVTASSYQIINDHLIGETPISKGVFMISAGNQMEYTNNAYEDPAPLNNRRMNVVLNPPIVKSEDGYSWTDWAINHGIDSRIVAYINAYETRLFKFEDDQKDPSFPTPRTWTRLSSMIKGVTDESTIKLYSGVLVGEGIGKEFVAFCKLTEKINVRDILNKPELMKKYAGPEHLDQRYSIVASVAELYAKEPKILDKALCLCRDCYMEPEFSMFMLKMMKALSKTPTKFSSELVACKNWGDISSSFSKYVL